MELLPELRQQSAREEGAVRHHGDVPLGPGHHPLQEPHGSRLDLRSGFPLVGPPQLVLLGVHKGEVHRGEVALVVREVAALVARVHSNHLAAELVCHEGRAAVRGDPRGRRALRGTQGGQGSKRRENCAEMCKTIHKTRTICVLAVATLDRSSAFARCTALSLAA